LDPEVQPIPVAAIERYPDVSQHLPEALDSRWVPPPPLDQRARSSCELIGPEGKLRVRRLLAEYRPEELASERREAPQRRHVLEDQHVPAEERLTAPLIVKRPLHHLDRRHLLPLQDDRSRPHTAAP